MKEDKTGWGTSMEFRKKVRELIGNTPEREIGYVTMPDGKKFWYYKKEEDERRI